MTQKKDNATKADWKEIFSSGPDGLRQLVQQVVQEVLEADMEETIGAQKSERTTERVGYRSGYYTRTLVTRVGKLVLRVPQDRQGRFRTEVFERYQRSEKALVCALAEMYVQGVSTRKVKEITEQLCGHEFSAASISRVTTQLDEELQEVRAAAAGGRIPVCGSGRALREGAAGRGDPQPGGASGHRDQLGGKALRAGGGNGQPGKRKHLERVSSKRITPLHARLATC